MPTSWQTIILYLSDNFRFLFSMYPNKIVTVEKTILSITHILAELCIPRITYYSWFILCTLTLGALVVPYGLSSSLYCPHFNLLRVSDLVDVPLSMHLSALIMHMLSCSIDHVSGSTHFECVNF
jgi:hypothetical protein